jgi:hypothetical protein
MARWRERAFREVRDELDRFLNYPLNQQIELGDFGIFDGKRCRFEWQGNLRDLKADCTSAGFQNEIAETYATAGVVSIQARLALGGTRPSADINFRRGAALAFRGHRIGFDQVQLIGVAKNLSAAIRGGLEWDRKRVIVTQIWKAEGFTHLVSGGKGASVQIEATAAKAEPGFNYADPTLGLQVTTERAMSYCSVGQTEVKPYFSVHKARETAPGEWNLYKYGLPN